MMAPVRPPGDQLFAVFDAGTQSIRGALVDVGGNVLDVVRTPIEPYVFDGFYFFARTLEKGSRLRLVVGCLDSPALQKNYNSGGVVAEETAEDARTATVKLYHDAEHPSVLEIPVRTGD